jgi:hypothetical protein
LKPPTLAESQAARIVAAHTNCLTEQLDPGGGAVQLPDYELRDAYQKRIGVLEVTSVVASDILSFNASRRKLDFSSDQLRCTWFVVMQSADFSHAELNRLSKVPPPLLIQTEDAGIAPFGPEALVPGFTYNVGDEPTTSLYEAGVKMLNLENSSGPRTLTENGPVVTLR